jgi:hypothetical protein
MGVGGQCDAPAALPVGKRHGAHCKEVTIKSIKKINTDRKFLLGSQEEFSKTGFENCLKNPTVKLL